MVKLEYNSDLLWESDWNGEEVGFPEVDVVGLYNFKNTNVYFYIDIFNDRILSAWEMIDDE